MNDIAQGLTESQQTFLADLLRRNDLPLEALGDIEIEFYQPEIEGIELILPPGCRSVEEMHQKIENSLIWVPECGDL